MWYALIFSVSDKQYMIDDCISLRYFCDSLSQPVCFGMWKCFPFQKTPYLILLHINPEQRLSVLRQYTFPNYFRVTKWKNSVCVQLFGGFSAKRSFCKNSFLTRFKRCGNSGEGKHGHTPPKHTKIQSCRLIDSQTINRGWCYLRDGLHLLLLGVGSSAVQHLEEVWRLGPHTCVNVGLWKRDSHQVSVERNAKHNPSSNPGTNLCTCRFFLCEK